MLWAFGKDFVNCSTVQYLPCAWFFRNAYRSSRSVADPHQFDADAKSAFHFDVDPDPACHFDADADPSFHFDPDADPSFQIKARNLEKVLKWAHIPYILALDPAYHFDADPDHDPTFQFNADPDSAPQH